VTSRIATATAPLPEGPALGGSPLAGSPLAGSSGSASLIAEAQLPAEPRVRARAPSLLSDYMALFKVRVTALVVITAWAGFYLGSVRSAIPSVHIGLFETLAGIALISAGAAALNEVLERKSDARMVRTAGRPLATGRISLPHGLLVAFAAVVAGSLLLLRFTNPITCALGLLTVFTYVAVYTPLKYRSTLATFIGAFPGAMGPLLGWTAARGRIE
jgi:protoheme IX farnesyltransferase